MKKLSACLLATSIFLLGNLHADLTLVQSVDGMGQKMETTTKIKGGRTRIDASPEMSMIMDLKSGDMISLLHGQKKYMKIPGSMAAAAMAGMQKKHEDQAPAALTPTGKKDTIGGYASEEYDCTLAGTKTVLWLTKALPDYKQMLQEMSAAFSEGPMAAMMKNLGIDFATLPGFPMRTVSEMRPGQSMTSTVVSVSANPLADADFEVPAGYEAMTMPSLTPPAAAGAAPAISK